MTNMVASNLLDFVSRMSILTTAIVCLHVFNAVLSDMISAYDSMVVWFMVLKVTQQYLRYIVAISFIDEENRTTRRKPPTCRKSLTNFITKYCIDGPYV
jgi:hypothetical protein